MHRRQLLSCHVGTGTHVTRLSGQAAAESHWLLTSTFLNSFSLQKLPDRPPLKCHLSDSWHFLLPDQELLHSQTTAYSIQTTAESPATEEGASQRKLFIFEKPLPDLKEPVLNPGSSLDGGPHAGFIGWYPETAVVITWGAPGVE